MFVPLHIGRNPREEGRVRERRSKRTEKGNSQASHWEIEARKKWKWGLGHHGERGWELWQQFTVRGKEGVAEAGGISHTTGLGITLNSAQSRQGVEGEGGANNPLWQNSLQNSSPPPHFCNLPVASSPNNPLKQNC